MTTLKIKNHELKGGACTIIGEETRTFATKSDMMDFYYQTIGINGLVYNRAEKVYKAVIYKYIA